MRVCHKIKPNQIKTKFCKRNWRARALFNKKRRFIAPSDKITNIKSKQTNIKIEFKLEIQFKNKTKTRTKAKIYFKQINNKQTKIDTTTTTSTTITNSKQANNNQQTINNKFKQSKSLQPEMKATKTTTTINNNKKRTTINNTSDCCKTCFCQTKATALLANKPLSNKQLNKQTNTNNKTITTNNNKSSICSNANYYLKKTTTKTKTITKQRKLADCCIEFCKLLALFASANYLLVTSATLSPSLPLPSSLSSPSSPSPSLSSHHQYLSSSAFAQTNTLNRAPSDWPPRGKHDFRFVSTLDRLLNEDLITLKDGINSRRKLKDFIRDQKNSQKPSESFEFVASRQFEEWQTKKEEEEEEKKDGKEKERAKDEEKQNKNKDNKSKDESLFVSSTDKGVNKDQLKSSQPNRTNRSNRSSRGGRSTHLNADRPVVVTRKGLVRGVSQKTATGKFVDAFLGVPYAQPPLGAYRFRHPQAANPWRGELDASKQPTSCYQQNDTFFGATFAGTQMWNPNTPLSEDCLYINIWTPFGVANITGSSLSYSSLEQQQERQEQQVGRRPVLVWIFGGGFYSGTTSLSIYDGGVLASEEDLVVVSINYRVSALGFLYFGRPDAPGNAGLFDQLMALQWIADNIDQFGGDPKRVTIFGESAGAVSASIHLLSPLSRNLFSQAILQSGSAICPWALREPRDLIKSGLALANALNCPSNSSDLESVVQCLLEAEPFALVSQDIVATSAMQLVKSVINFPFVPVVDGSFLVESPQESLAKNNFKQANLLLGSNNEEGNYWLVYHVPELATCPLVAQQNSASNSVVVSSSVSEINETLFQTTQQAQAQTKTKTKRLVNSRSSNSQLVSSIQVPLSIPISNLNPTTLTSTLSLNQNSESCSPVDAPALSREQFLAALKEDINPYASNEIARNAIAFEYIDWTAPPNDSTANYDALDKIVGDYFFMCHVNEFASNYVQASNSVFMYYFKHRSTRSSWPRWMGVLHGDEISFIFGEPLNAALNYTTPEVELSKRMMRYWANFAKFGCVQLNVYLNSFVIFTLLYLLTSIFVMF